MSANYAHLNDTQLDTHIAHLDAWSRNYPVAAASPTSNMARMLREMTAERERRANARQVPERLRELIAKARAERDAAEHDSTAYWHAVGIIEGLMVAETVIANALPTTAR